MDNVTLVPNKRRKRYSIEINEQAEVIVRTPWRASKKIINELIEEHQDWILRQKTKQQKINSALSDWHDPDTLYFRGKKVEWRYSDVPVTAFGQSNTCALPFK